VFARLTVALALVYPLGVASAQTSVQGLFSVAGGATDNVLSRPTDPPPGTPLPEPDGFSDIRPQLLLAHLGSRSAFQLGYSFAARLYLQHAEGNTYSNQVDFTSYIEASRNTELLLGAIATQGVSYSFRALTDPTQATADVIPTQRVNFLSTSAREALGWDLTRDWRLLENFSLGRFQSLDDIPTQATSWLVSARVAAERAFGRNALGFEVGTEAILAEELRTDAGLASASSQDFVNRLVGRWRYDWTRAWSSQVDLGILHVYSQTAGASGNLAGLTGLFEVRYNHPDGTATIGFRHSPRLNALVGGVFLEDEVSLRGTMPLWRKAHISGSAGTGYQYGAEINPNNAELTSTAQLVFADAALSWTPSPQWALSLRYQLFDQIGDPGDMRPIPSIIRNEILLSVTAVYPGEGPRQRVPTQLAVRVDRTDQPGAGGSSRSQGRTGEDTGGGGE
jgi:hypothetical protein